MHLNKARKIRSLKNKAKSQKAPPSAVSNPVTIKIYWVGSDIKYILHFILESWSVEDLERCYVLRLANDSFAKVARITENDNIFYVIDKDGFDLFEQLGSRCLISPNIFDQEVTKKLKLLPGFNVHPFDDVAIGQLLRRNIQLRRVVTFTENESQWLTAIYRYVISHHLDCDFYQDLPTLLLSNKPNTFVSINFWNNRRLMPPIEGPGTRRITNKFLDLFILANLEFEPMNNLVTTTSAERFIDYLYHAAKNDLMRIERIFRDRGIVGDSYIQINTEKKFVLIA